VQRLCRMKISTSIARIAGQRLTALLLLVVSLLLPVAPLLAASVRSAAEVCQCCRRKGHDACRRLQAAPASGSSWNASPDCARGCGQPVGVASTTPFLSPETVQSTGVLPQIDGLPATIPPYRFSTAYAAWRYQRPPPLF